MIIGATWAWSIFLNWARRRKRYGSSTAPPLKIRPWQSACAAQILSILSGGKPAYLYNSLQDTPVWQAITQVLQRGGVVAGCSAGAMIFGEHTPPSLFSTQWQTAFNFLPGAFIIPPFDEIPRMMLHGMRLVAGKLKMIGVEGSTALVCGPEGVSVQGLGSVALIDDGHETRFGAGSVL